MRNDSCLFRVMLIAVAAGLAGAALAQPRPGGSPAQAPQRPPQGQPPQPQLAPARPYNIVAVKQPAPMTDPSFEAFRKQLGEAARKKDRAALGRLIAAQGFFWQAENGDRADKKKSGLDNLAAAIGLSGRDAPGWDMLVGYAEDPTAAPLPQKQGVICAPADPEFDERAFEDLAKQTSTDPGEWGYPLAADIEVRARPLANAPVIEKLGMHFVRVMPEMGPGGRGPGGPAGSGGQPPFLRIVTPSGKTGYISPDALSPLGSDQLCYVKEGDSWKINGFIGAGEQ